jgi:hypothetical protein
LFVIGRGFLITKRCQLSHEKKRPLLGRPLYANIKSTSEREKECTKLISNDPIDPVPRGTITIGYKIVIAVVPVGNSS